MPPVLHVDLDQFIAAVEVRRRPELAGLPVVVGGRGDPTERGVVATASYEARAFGVGSGMPLRIAVRKCPEAIFLPVDMEAYAAASTEVMAVVRSREWGGHPVAVQVLGMDEAFAGPAADADREHLEAAEEVAAGLRAAIEEETGLTSAVGIGDNVLQAKLATGFAKQKVSGAAAPERTPDAVVGNSGGGIYRISDASWFEEMGARPARALWGIGAKIAGRLEALGIATVEDLARADPATLAEAFGPTTGPRLRRLGRGVADTEVDPTPWIPRGHGREETFQTDLAEWVEVEEQVRRIARLVTADIAAEGRPAVRVEIKVRLRPFFTVTRSHKLPAPTDDPEVLAQEAVALLDRLDPADRERPVQLIGVRLEMTPPE